MTCKYSSLVGIRPASAAEAPASYHCLTERHIQALWLEQKYFKPLKTSTGLPIQVVSPGIWNAEAGPDFLRAHFVIGGTIVKGDVEIHLSEEAWIQHHHHRDPRYNGVVLHLSLWNPQKEHFFCTEDQQPFYSAYLEDFLTVSISRLLSLIDLELYPYKKFLGSGKCSKLLFKRLPSLQISELFNEAALWRLSQKHHFLREQTPNPRLWMGAGVAMALGYKKNAEAFLQLYLWFNAHPFSEEEKVFALLLKACGFFAAHYQKKWEACPTYARLLTSLPSAIAPLPTFELNTFKIRPFNHPLRRLAFLAKFMVDIAHYSLSERLFSSWDSKWRMLKSKKDHSLLRQELIDKLPCYQDAFFNRHYTFGSPPQEEFLPLAGKDIKQTILINSFLPLLAEKISQKGDGEEWDAFNAFYASFPSEHSSKTAYLIHRFFGDSPKGGLLGYANTEQGAYQIHRDFCMHYEASCDGCPFVERYTKNYPR